VISRESNELVSALEILLSVLSRGLRNFCLYHYFRRACMRAFISWVRVQIEAMRMLACMCHGDRGDEDRSSRPKTKEMIARSCKNRKRANRVQLLHVA
jgi:hypothetical protein